MPDRALAVVCASVSGGKGLFALFAWTGSAPGLVTERRQLAWTLWEPLQLMMLLLAWTERARLLVREKFFQWLVLLLLWTERARLLAMARTPTAAS